MAKRKRDRAGTSKGKAPSPQGALSLDARVRSTLSAFASTTAWRTVLSVMVAVLTYWTIAGGVMKSWPGPQVAVVLGIVTALVAPGWLAALTVALGVYAVGAMTGPAVFWFVGNPAYAPQALVGWAILAAAVAAGVSYVVEQRWLKPDWLLWLAIAIVVVNMWAGVITANREGYLEANTGLAVPSLEQIIETGNAPEAMKTNDGLYHLVVVRKLKAGESYYPAASEALDRDGSGTIKGPSGVLNLREPLLYWFLAALPSAMAVFVAYLMLVSGAAIGILAALRDVVRAPLVLPGIFAVLSWSIPFSTTIMLYTSELWMGTLALVAFTLFAVSVRREPWRPWVAAAVSVAVLAFLVREFAGTLFVGGALAAALGPADRRRWSLVAWGVGALVAAAGYVAHVAAVQPFLTGAPGMELLGRGGIAFALGGLTFSTLTFGTGIAAVLAVLAYAGAVLMPDVGRRSFALVVLVTPMVLFLFVGNGALDPLSGAPVNYWSESFMPVAYACIPAVFALVPGAVPARRLSGPAAS
ncbi:MAG: hypothetical protein HY876_09920 [Coriobacteriales bacterium]|nr:hypothetical protein [Coriobacteriales bacterium]